MIVYIGIDWSREKHDVCMINERGQVIVSFEIKHDEAGFVEIEQNRQKLDVKPEECIVGIETAQNLLVDYLWDQGYQKVYILPPGVVKSTQGRFRQSRAKSDPWDARLIADMLRTDRHRYCLWKPDNVITRQIRVAVRFINSLTKDITRNTNQLRAVLHRYYPEAVNVFCKVNYLIALKFIQTYPTPDQAEKLTFEEFKKFARENRHTQPKKLAKCYSRLKDSYPPVNQAVINIYAPQAKSIATILEQLVIQKKKWLKKLTTLYLQHPDQKIYSSLPAAGAFLEPALLGKLGDDRNRYPSPSVLQAVAGTCPVTQHSGKRKVIFFRYACDHEFRAIVQQWARASLDYSPWANSYYRAVRPHAKTDSDAIRRLANRWLAVLWRIWQDQVPYDEAYHLKRRALRNKPQ